MPAEPAYCGPEIGWAMSQDGSRRERLRQALRDNLRRRKAQARARRDTDGASGREPAGRPAAPERTPGVEE